MMKILNVLFLFCMIFNSCENSSEKLRGSKELINITKFRDLDTVSLNISDDSLFKNKCQLFGEKRDYENRKTIYKNFDLKPIDKVSDTISYRFFSYKGWGNFYSLPYTSAITVSKCKNDYFVEIIEMNREHNLLGKKNIIKIDSLNFIELQDIVRNGGYYKAFSFHYAPCMLLVDGSFYAFEFNDGKNYKYFDIRTINKMDIKLFRQFLVISKNYSEKIAKLDEYQEK